MSARTATPEEPTELSDIDGGRWVVLTEASMYCLDLEQRMLCRFPGRGTGPHDKENPRFILVFSFDNDYTWMTLFRLLDCRIGQSLRAVVADPSGVTGPVRSTYINRIVEFDWFFATDLPNAVEARRDDHGRREAAPESATNDDGM